MSSTDVEIGSKVTATVLRTADYGAIVRLSDSETGLIHISEIAESYVRDVRDYLREGDEVAVKVLRINKGRYELSLKQCDTATPVETSAKQAPTRHLGFEDRLTKFLKESEERQHDLKRHTDSKRGR